MSRKFLDDIGYVDELAGIENDGAYGGRFAKQQKIYGFDDRDTWNLHITMVKLLYERLKMYDKVNIVDTSFHTIEHNNQVLTMQDVLELMVDLAEEVLTSDSNEYVEALNEEEDEFFTNTQIETLDAGTDFSTDDESYSEPVPAPPFQSTKEGYWFFKRHRAIEMDAYWAEQELWQLWSKSHMYFWW